jgi:hypothetical protein
MATLAIAATATPVTSQHADALLRSLIGKDETTIVRRFGLPEERESNSVQTFLRNRSIYPWRAGPGFHGRVNSGCLITLMLRVGNLVNLPNRADHAQIRHSLGLDKSRRLP